MGIKELREKYGDTKGRTAINRGVREEIPGGGEIIEAEFLIGDLLANTTLTDWQAHKLKAIQSKIVAAARACRDEICRRYGVVAGENEED